MERTEKVTLFHSISFRIVLLVIAITVGTLAGSILGASSKAESVLGNSNENYILSLAELGAERIMDMKEQSDDAARYQTVMESMDMKGISSAYAYMVAPDGTMLYHPTADKIGQPVENAIIKGVVAEIAAGKTPADAVVEYDYNGAPKYAGYSLTDDQKIVVVTADKDEIMEPLSDMVRFMILIASLTLIAAVAAGYVMSMFICRPIQKVTRIITKTARLDFTPNEDDERLAARSDETGLMAREVVKMRGNLLDIVHSIADASDAITENMDGLKQATDLIHSMCMDNSATSQELAAAMEEAAATTINVNENVQTMSKDAEAIEQFAGRGAKQSEEVMERAKGLGDKTEQASRRTIALYQNVKVKSEQAIEGSKSVRRINELSETIMKISSQTSLLALNASIEAARAGDAGRGFAVVATEIGNLADQTQTAIANIGTIVQEVNEAVSHMTECMEETTTFLEENVLSDYKEFKDVSLQYQEDADAYGSNMNQVKDAIVHLTSLTQTSAEALDGIKDTTNESAAGVTDIAQKTIRGNEMVAVCYECADNLREIVARFTL